MNSETIERFKEKVQIFWPWLGGLLLLLILIALWVPLASIGSDAKLLRQWIEPFGLLAPVVYFGLNVLQIVIAPIPGYTVQMLGGVLFGPVVGTICVVGGMTVGGVVAAAVGRKFGRPWLANRLGQETLDSWSDVAHVHSFWTWWVILLIPLGDIPYFFAGLSQISLWRFALAILTSRGPFSVLIVIFGDQVTFLPLGWLTLLMALIGLVALLGYSQYERFEAWGQSYVAQKIDNE